MGKNGEAKGTKFHTSTSFIPNLSF